MKPERLPSWTGYQVLPPAVIGAPVACTSEPSAMFAKILPSMDGLSRRFAPSPSVFATTNFFTAGAVAVLVGGGEGVPVACAGVAGDGEAAGDNGAASAE